MRCQRLISDPQRQACPYGVGTLFEWSRGISHRRARDRPHLAGEPQNREEIAAVRLDVNVDDLFAQVVDKWNSKGRGCVKDQDAVAVIRCVELLARAEHPL